MRFLLSIDNFEIFYYNLYNVHLEAFVTKFFKLFYKHIEYSEPHPLFYLFFGGILHTVCVALMKYFMFKLL